MRLRVVLAVIFCFCVCTQGCSCRKKPNRQQVAPLNTSEIVSDDSTDGLVPDAVPARTLPVSEKDAETTGESQTRGTRPQDGTDTGAKPSVAQLSQQLSRAENHLKGGELAKAYHEAMQISQACQAANSAGSPLAGVSDLQERSEKIMQEIARQSGGRTPETKPLVITGQ